MKKTTKMKLTVIAAAATLLLTPAASVASESIKVSKDFLDRTGITVQMHSLTDMVVESSQVHAERCGTQLISTDIPSFKADSVIFDTVLSFNKINTQSFKPVEAWYHSELALKIQTAETEVIDYSALGPFLKTALYKNQHRKELIGNIVDTLQIARYVATIGTEVEYAGILNSGCLNRSNINKLNNNESGTSNSNREQMLADITREDKNLTALLLHGDIVAETAYLFRSLTDKELAEYEAFTSSADAKTFYSNLIEAVQMSLQLAGDRLRNSRENDLHGSIDF